MSELDLPAIRARLEVHRAEARPTLEVLGHSPRRPGVVGLVPGSFDPMTVAHAALAGALHERGCELVLLVHSSRTLAKEGPVTPPLLPPEARIASLLDWTSRRPGFATALSSHGLYSDQARAAAAAFPDADVVIGLGSDKVLQLFDPSWYEDRDASLHDLFAVARVAYAARAGDEARVRAVLEREGAWVSGVEEMPIAEELAGLSSSEVRRRHRRGEDVTSLIPAEIRPYLPRPRDP